MCESYSTTQCSVGSIKLYSNKNVECLLPVFMTVSFRFLLSALYHLFDLYCPFSSYFIYLRSVESVMNCVRDVQCKLLCFGSFAPPFAPFIVLFWLRWSHILVIYRRIYVHTWTTKLTLKLAGMMENWTMCTLLNHLCRTVR